MNRNEVMRKYKITPGQVLILRALWGGDLTVKWPDGSSYQRTHHPDESEDPDDRFRKRCKMEVSDDDFDYNRAQSLYIFLSNDELRAVLELDRPTA